MARISLIVPVYNTRIDYLRRCVESILFQDHEDKELILVNDGADSDLCDSYEALCKKYPQIKYIYQENQGVSVARNAGLDAATGDFVMFVDSDDFISEGLLSDLEKRMSPDLDILFFGYCTSYTNRELERVIKNPDPELFTPEVLQRAILNANPAIGPLEVGAPWGKFIRRSVIEENGVRFKRGLKKGQDTVFTLHLLQHCRNVSYASVCGYHYRVVSTSISHRFSADIVAIMEKTLDAYTDFVRQYKTDGSFDQLLMTKYYRVLTGEYLDLYFMHKDNPADDETLRKEYARLLSKDCYKKAVQGMADVDLKGLGALVYRLVKNRRLRTLWALKKSMQIAKGIIVNDYE
ncbi:MAG: glycosyltransferase [Lachnospiraceae bacterium]|nr:glycosyltransferase [Lachnospiraceae bacterium]